MPTRQSKRGPILGVTVNKTSRDPLPFIKRIGATNAKDKEGDHDDLAPAAWPQMPALTIFDPPFLTSIDPGGHLAA